MKWLLVLILIVGGGIYFYMNRDTTPRTPTGSRGVAGAFLDRSRAGDVAGATALALPGAEEMVDRAANQIINMGLASNWVPSWQRASATTGDDAWQVQITGKGSILVVETKADAAGVHKIMSAAVSSL